MPIMWESFYPAVVERHCKQTIDTCHEKPLFCFVLLSLLGTLRNAWRVNTSLKQHMMLISTPFFLYWRKRDRHNDISHTEASCACGPHSSRITTQILISKATSSLEITDKLPSKELGFDPGQGVLKDTSPFRQKQIGRLAQS